MEFLRPFPVPKPTLRASVRLLAFAIHLAFFVFPQALCGQTDSDSVPSRYILLFRNRVVPKDVEARFAPLGAHLVSRNDRFGIAVVQVTHSAATSDYRQLREENERDELSFHRLAGEPGVEYVLHDRLVKAHHLRIRSIPADLTFKVTVKQPYDTYYNSPQGWAVRQVGGYGAHIPGGPSQGPWDITTGMGVRVAILDSGVDEHHPDIEPNLALNLSEVNQSDLPTPCDDGSPQDQQGHGTWAASLAAAAAGPGTGLVIGVAPSATILNIKVLQRMPAVISGNTSIAAECASGEASGLLSWVLQGIQDAISNHAEVISLSLGIIVDMSTPEGAGLKAVFDQVASAATQAGAVIVAAAGNDAYNLSAPRYMELPAQARGVLTIVASTNPECAEDTTPNATCAPGASTLAYYSNYGAPLDALAAPGGSYPIGSGDLSVSGWIRGACSSGNPNTLDGIPSDSEHSFGCFNLGHAAYVQAIGTSASAPLAAGVAALVRAAHPDWDANTVINALRSSADNVSALPVPLIDASSALKQR